MNTIATSHGVEIAVYSPALEPDYPNAFSRKYPYSITGCWWIGDEPTHTASFLVIQEAERRGASVADDSESGQMFLNGSTVADCVILTEVLRDQGRLPKDAPEVVWTAPPTPTMREAKAILLDLLIDHTDAKVRQEALAYIEAN